MIDLWVVDTIAYVAESFDGLGVINVRDPDNPRRIAQHPSVQGAQLIGVQVIGNLAFIGNGYAGLRIWDVSDPINVKEVGYYVTDGIAGSVCYNNGIIHLANDANGYRALEYYGAGIEEREKREEVFFECLPLIGRGKFEIRANNDKGLFIRVYDTQGKLVKRERLSEGNRILSLSEKPIGIYFLVLESREKFPMKKIVNLK